MNWIKVRSPEESLEIVREIACTCSKLGGPYAKKLYELLCERKFLEIINHKFDYRDPETSVTDYLYARQIHALVAKQDYIEIGVDKEAVAFSKFKECEEKCRKTNDRFLIEKSLDKDVSIVLHYAQRKISSILGDLPSLSSFDFSFGPGANTSVKKASSHPAVKLNASLTCSSNLLPIAQEFVNEFPGWIRERSTLNKYKLALSHSKLVFVPKDSRTFRPIGVEPLLNGLGQKGIGSYLRKRLKMFGVDLKSQERNQKLAERGSVDNSLATIDLSSASDTISYGLVMDLLPYDWFCFLDYFRSPTISYKGEIIELERFSSMGNAYTFELESLIFYSLCYGVSKYLNIETADISVYGDDIIVPVSMVETLYRVIESCGFTVNSEKSFCSGPFRESCGADYLLGSDIRPFYQKTQIADRDLFVMHNWFLRRGENLLAAKAKSFIHKPNLLFGPDGYGDGHLIGTYSLRSSRSLRRKGFEGGFFDTYTLTPKRFKYKPNVSYVYPLYCIYVEGHQVDAKKHDILPGTSGYHRLSLYTLERSVFRRPVKRVHLAHQLGL